MARPIPATFVPIIRQAASKWGVPPELITAVISWESGFSPGRVNVNETKGGFSWGLMQVQVPTASDYIRNITPDQLLWPETNIDVGTWYLKKMLDRFNWIIPDAISAYNAGPGNVNPGKPYVNPKYVNGVGALYEAYKEHWNVLSAAGLNQERMGYLIVLASQEAYATGGNVQEILGRMLVQEFIGANIVADPSMYVVETANEDSWVTPLLIGIGITAL